MYLPCFVFPVKRELPYGRHGSTNLTQMFNVLIVQEVKARSGNEGYHVAAGEYIALVKANVVDSTKETKRPALRL